MLAIPEDGCEMRLLGTSPVFSKDYFVSAMPEYCPPSFYEEEIAAEVNISCDTEFHDRSLLYSESGYNNTSCGTSVTSDFSDDSFIDNEEDFDIFSKNDDTSLDVKSLGTTSTKDSVYPVKRLNNAGYEDSNSDTDDAEMLSFNEHGCCDSSSKKMSKSTSCRKQECSCCELRKRMAGLSWSKMTSDDQLQSIEYLTRVVSTTLGLREQLDVIRIICPDATVSTSDTEFFIDLDAFNDAKFQQLKLYVSEHVSSNSCKKCSESRHKSHASKSSPTSHPKYSKRKAPKPLSTKPVSKKSRKSKGLLSRIHRQMEKEKRSGLFSREEVVSLSRKSSLSECEEDVEIDILC